MQVMLAAFIQMNTKNTGIQSVQADQIGRTYPPLFTLNLPKEDEIIDDLKEITAMEYVVQVIMIIVCIAVVIIVMYFCCTKCRHTHTILKYCFPFLPISRIVRMSRRTDLFVEVTNVTKGNGIWTHFALTGCFPSQIQMSRPIQKADVQIETFCCIFKCQVLQVIVLRKCIPLSLPKSPSMATYESLTRIHFPTICITVLFIMFVILCLLLTYVNIIMEIHK